MEYSYIYLSIVEIYWANETVCVAIWHVSLPELCFELGHKTFHHGQHLCHGYFATMAKSPIQLKVDWFAKICWYSMSLAAFASFITKRNCNTNLWWSFPFLCPFEHPSYGVTFQSIHMYDRTPVQQGKFLCYFPLLQFKREWSDHESLHIPKILCKIEITVVGWVFEDINFITNSCWLRFLKPMDACIQCKGTENVTTESPLHISASTSITASTYISTFYLLFHLDLHIDEYQYQ